MKANEIVQALSEAEKDIVAEYRAEMKKVIENEFGQVQAKLVKLTDDFIAQAQEQGISLYGVDDGELGRMIDDMAQCAAMIQDKLEGNFAFAREGDKTYSKSKLRKVRKALGYNL